MRTHKQLIIGLILVGIIGAVFIVRLQGNKNMATNGNSQANTATTDTVVIEGYAFKPAAISIKTGQTVTWTNNDGVHHNVIADSASNIAPNGPLIGKGESFKYTFKKPGTYTYHCGPHPYMHGSVVVTE